MRRWSAAVVVSALIALVAAPGGVAWAGSAGPQIDAASMYNGGAPCGQPGSSPLVGLRLLQAVGTDAGASGLVMYRFSYWPAGHPSSAHTVTQQTAAGGLASAWVSLPASGGYVWRVQLHDSNGTSSWSPECSFTYDTGTPSTPTVTSPNYPQGTRGPLGRAPRFVLTGRGDAHVAGFEYSWQQTMPSIACQSSGPDGQIVCPDPFTLPDTVRAGAPGGTASVTINAPAAGPQTLWVEALDGAGIASSEASYTMEVPESGPVLDTAVAVCGPEATVQLSPHASVPNVVAYQYSLGSSGSTTQLAASEHLATLTFPVDPALQFLDVNVQSISSYGFISTVTQYGLSIDPMPGVSSAQYPGGGAPGASAGTPGTFRLTGPTNWGMSSYSYAFDGAAAHTVDSTDGYSAAVTWTPTTSGTHTLTVTGNGSYLSNPGLTCAARYTFAVAPASTSTSSTPPSSSAHVSSTPPTPHSSSASRATAGNQPASARHGRLASTGTGLRAPVIIGLLLIGVGAVLLAWLAIPRERWVGRHG
jgi:hypothetical protein